MQTNDIKVVLWNSEYEKQALDLLNKYKATSIFLLGNLKGSGFVLERFENFLNQTRLNHWWGLFIIQKNYPQNLWITLCKTYENFL